jgi:hypothetical protein
MVVLTFTITLCVNRRANEKAELPGPPARPACRAQPGCGPGGLQRCGSLRSFVCPALGLTAMITVGPGVVVGYGRT